MELQTGLPKLCLCSQESWIGLGWVGRSLKLTQCHSCHGRNTYHCPRLPPALSSLVLGTAWDPGTLALAVGCFVGSQMREGWTSSSSHPNPAPDFPAEGMLQGARQVWADTKGEEQIPLCCSHLAPRHRTNPKAWHCQLELSPSPIPAPTRIRKQGGNISSWIYLPSCWQSAPSAGDPPRAQRQSYSQK